MGRRRRALTWSLWDGGRAAADVAQAAGRRHGRAPSACAEFDSVLGRRSAAARARDRVRQSRRWPLQTSAVTARRRGARACVGERYRAGVIAQGDVLDAELRAAPEPARSDTRAQASVRLAEARLDRVMGR